MSSYVGMYRTFLLLSMAALLGVGACGDGDSDGARVGAADAAPADGSGALPDAGTDGWKELVGADWHLDAGKEGYFCATKVIHEKTFVGAFRPIAPVGTHHTLLSYGPAEPGEVDQTSFACDFLNEKPNWIFASGVGTDALVLPEGVGMVLDPGTVLHINLHLFNTGDQALDGHSGVEIQTLAAGAVQHEADIVLAGTLDFNIPKGTTTSVTGECAVDRDQTIFALFPHMHQLGRHLKTEIKHAGETSVLWDGDYRFDQQPFFNFDPVSLHAGDKIDTTCTWDYFPTSPDAPDEVTFGESSDTEMCFSILMRYPRAEPGVQSHLCTGSVAQE
jgi:hypothetical protein